jgi:hypothetical protein
VVLVLIAIAGVASVFGVAVAQNKNQGEVGTRTTEYAQDKMEQLMTLSFTDNSTDTTVYPSNPAGGSGLGGVMAGNATVGGTNKAAPVNGYVDYLDAQGNLLPNAAGKFYSRLWSITTNATGNLKTITVVAYAESETGNKGTPPLTALICAKSNRQ